MAVRGALRYGMVSLLIAVPSAHAAQPTPLGLSCLGCHQPAVEAPAMPALDRQPPERIASALRGFRDHPQPGSVMSRFMPPLTDADIDRLAAELGTSPRP